jgi:hypothetical protein
MLLARLLQMIAEAFDDDLNKNSTNPYVYLCDDGLLLLVAKLKLQMKSLALNKSIITVNEIFFFSSIK